MGQTRQRVLERDLQFAEVAFCSVLERAEKELSDDRQKFLSPPQLGQSLSDLGRGARRILFSIIFNGARTSALLNPLKIFDSWNRCESETCLFEYVGLPFSGKCYWKRAQ